MSLQHFSHRHPLILIRKKVYPTDGGNEMFCYACHQPILSTSAVAVAAGGEDADVYICGEDDNCDDGFCLHKKCAESPREIQHPMHDPHPLTLQSRPPYNSKSCSCNVCRRDWDWFTYNCDSCEFDVCMTCASSQTILEAVDKNRSFHHVGHGQHTPTLIHRKALFECDACGTKAEDSSYVCNSCNFWMHKACASSPAILEAGDIHHHPLLLTYSLPDIHRTFRQYCRICKQKIIPSRWLYYCDECTYFGYQMFNKTNNVVKYKYKNENGFRSGEKDKSGDEPQEENREEDDLVKFPVDSKESFIHLMIDQFTKWNLENNSINLQKSDEDHPLELLQELDGSTSTGDHQQSLANHWIHKDHPLELLQELVGSEQVEEIICNVCVQPIVTLATTQYPFYGCIQCNFFLHKFCLQLPRQLPAGAITLHPQHPLILSYRKNPFFSVTCRACGLLTNGFYYECETCRITFDIRCCFLLPNRIKHQSHNHPLLHSSPSSNSTSDACGSFCNKEVFKCERMSCNFQIHKGCSFLPGKMRHRWDPHTIPLIYPHLDHQGLIYCEICEDQIDTNYWLYHCDKCEHSFHIFCLYPMHNVKIGDCKLVPRLHKHTLTFVYKEKDHHCLLSCSECRSDLRTCTYNPVVSEGTYYRPFVLECLNCDVLFCVFCVWYHL